MSDPAQVSLRSLNDCGCCGGTQVETPANVSNRSGMTAITYRIGTHAQFKESMLAALSDSSRPALQSLRTRDNDDFSIALLDAAATMADVLAFYQERIANESYLRTATERRSVLEMARLIGYELRPGVAASTLLAFTLDQTPGAPKQTTIDVGTKVQSIPAPGEKPQTFETIEKIQARVDWNALRPQISAPQPIARNQTHLLLKGVNTQLSPGDAILIVGDERANNPTTSPDRERWDFRVVESVTPDPKLNSTIVTWEKGLDGGSIGPAAQNVKCFAMRQRAKLFGNNAPDWFAMPHSVRIAYLVQAKQDITKYRSNDPNTWGSNWPSDWFKIRTIPQKQIDLDAAHPKIVRNNWVALQQSNDVELYKIVQATTDSRSDFAISSPSTQLTLDTDLNLNKFQLRTTTLFLQSEQLDIAELPNPDISGSVVLMAPSPGLGDLVKGQWVAASGIDVSTGVVSSEMVSISDINGTTLTLNPSLSETKKYKLDSFALNANVARATHGETVQEVLGSGNGSQIFQKFMLKQPPLTYIPAANATGTASTLQVRVNGLAWHETPTLYKRGAHDHLFITRRDDAGKTALEFGDGITGSRLPTGQMNIRASYRKGTGLEGTLKAGQLSMLLSRPLGLKGVNNPVDTSGGQDPEQLKDARVNAPSTVMTLDRAVSLEDYEEFSRTFAGVAKALATWTWDGLGRRIFITVAGPRGASITSDSDTYQKLLAALQASGDPFVPIRVATYLSVSFRLAGTVKVDPDFESDRVLAAVTDTLRSQFSFETRSFGQAVILSEVIELIQNVPGVIAVNITQLYRSTVSSREERLLASLPSLLPNGTMQAAELLTLDAGPLDSLGVMP